MKINLTNYKNNDNILNEIYHNIRRYEALREEYYDEEIDREINNLQKIIFDKLVNSEFIAAVYNLNKMTELISEFDSVAYDYY